jgi:hypothetical protein
MAWPIRFAGHLQAAAWFSGHDRDSLVAQLVRRADQASTQRALLSGHKGRFPTSKSKPLIHLLIEISFGQGLFAREQVSGAHARQIGTAAKTQG